MPFQIRPLAFITTAFDSDLTAHETIYSPFHTYLAHHITRSWATTHTRLRARDHYTSSTLIGGKGGAGTSSLHTTLEGPTEYVNARWMWSLHGFLRGIEWIVLDDHLDHFQKPLLGGRFDTKPEDHGIPNAHNRWFIIFYHVRTCMNRCSWR